MIRRWGGVLMAVSQHGLGFQGVTFLLHCFIRVEFHNYLHVRPGYERLREFIITQHPLTHTVEDFWRMVWDHNVQTVVVLSPSDEEVRATCAGSLFRIHDTPTVLVLPNSLLHRSLSL